MSSEGDRSIIRIRQRLYEIIEAAKPGDRASRIFDLFLVVIIVLNVCAVVVSTVPSISGCIQRFLDWFEIVSVILFSIEYLLRIWTAVQSSRFRDPIAGRIKYVFSPIALIDLLAILPFYLPLLIPIDLRFLRALRLFRLLRLLKMGRYSTAMQTVSAVMKKKRYELVMTFMILSVLLVISSGLMYFVENETQPDKFGSIPETMWWSICTLTTVGYGDVFPVTPLGKLCAGFIALLGIGMFALPAGILASGFDQELTGKGRRKLKCPQCQASLVLQDCILHSEEKR